MQQSGVQIMIDRLFVIQMTNVAAGAVVSLIAMIFLADTDILASQAIFSSAQISTTMLAITLATVSLESALRATQRNIIAALVGGGIIWLMLLMFSNSSLVNHFTIAVLFLFSLIIGELSAFPRAKIVNSEMSRLPLAVVNTLATAIRLASFFAFLAPLGALSSFVLSAVLSNVVRASTLSWVAKACIGQNTMCTVGRVKLPATSLSYLHRVGAYLDRNPTVLVVLSISHFQPLLGLAPSDYALSILIMSFSSAVAGMMWIKFENVKVSITFATLKPLYFAFILLSTTAFAFTYLLPQGLIKANSLANLQAQPVALVLLPILFGLSAGLNVFTYGSVLSLLKSLITAIAFLIVSQYGFFFGILINLGFFFIYIRSASSHLQPPNVTNKRGKH